MTGLLADLRAKRRALLDDQRRATASAKRQRLIEQAVGIARTALDARDADAALAALVGLDAEARAAEPVRHLIDEAESLRATVERDWAERRAAGLAAAATALTNGETLGARRVLESLAADALGGVEVDDALAAVAQAEEAVERRRRRDAGLQAGLKRVLAAVAARNLTAATESLRRLADEGFTPDELAPATVAIAAGEEELARDRAREQARAQALTAVESAIGKRDPSAARRGLEQLRGLGEPPDLIASLESRCAALEGALQTENARAQQRREDRSALEAAIARRDEAGARSTLDRLKRDGVADTDLQDVLRRLESLARELAQERDLAQRLEAASRATTEALGARNTAGARASIATLRTLGADVALLRTLEERLGELEAELAAEAEAIRWRAEQLAVVKRALDQRRADEATAALTVLRERGARGPDIDACAARAAAATPRDGRAAGAGGAPRRHVGTRSPSPSSVKTSVRLSACCERWRARVPHLRRSRRPEPGPLRWQPRSNSNDAAKPSSAGGSMRSSGRLPRISPKKRDAA